MEVYITMFKYIHDINAKVEDGRRYLTDVVKLEMKPKDDKFLVTAEPAVQIGEESIMTVPVHPKTVSEPKIVPTYGTPTKLKVLVRKGTDEIVQDMSNGNHSNWEEKEVDVSPIVYEIFDTEEMAAEFYDKVADQISEGDELRHLPRPDTNLRGYGNTAQYNRY